MKPIASLTARVGVFSFARFDPTFYGESRGVDYERILLKRSLKVVIHEIGHMFGIKHCVWFNCLMRGSNHLQEADSKPMHFCPVCLRKLQSTIGFSIETRFQNIYDFLTETGYFREAKWYQDRLKKNNIIHPQIS